MEHENNAVKKEKMSTAGETVQADKKQTYHKVKKSSKSANDQNKLKWISVVLIIVMAIAIFIIWMLGQTDWNQQDGGVYDVIDALDGNQNAAPGVKPDNDKSDSDGDSASVESANRYGISSSSSYATEAGAKILEAGGNAVDAAIAISYTLGVSEPYASGIGGGGAMMIYDPATESFSFYNYASEAPQSGGSDLILVPGFVSGMEAVRKDFGTMEFADLVQSAIECCDGITVNKGCATRIASVANYVSRDSIFYGPDGYLKEGDTLVQPELKQTLLRMIDEGPDSFYTGSIAEDIAAAMPLSLEDLAAYETIKTDAVVSTFNGYTIGAASAPFSGMTLIQMLKMAEMLEIPDPDVDNAAYLKALLKATNTAQVERLEKICDYRFAKEALNQSDMVSDDYVAALLDIDVGTNIEEEEHIDTTGFTVVDKNGMVVACTNTLSGYFGSMRSVDGIFMNNSGYLFGYSINGYQAGKRPRSHISPAILVSDDEVVAIASPGGNMITKVLGTVLLDVCAFDEDPQVAVNKQRIAFLYGNALYYEIGYDTPLQAEVSGYGYSAIAYPDHGLFGNVALCGYNTEDGYFAAEDARRHGSCIVSNG